MAKKNNLIKIAKGESNNSPSAGTDAVSKAKQKVTKLLEDVTLVPKEKELFELDEKLSEEGSVEWLKEQVNLLTAENEKLRKELANAKNINFETKVLELFTEFQTEFLKHPPQTMAWTTIYLSELLKKMLKAFSFLEKYKRF